MPRLASLIGFACVAFWAAPAAETVLYSVNFNGPSYVAGQPLVAKGPPAGVSEIVFGAPKVQASYGSLTDQPLVLRSDGDYDYFYNQIRFAIGQWVEPIFRLEFDVDTGTIAGSSSGLSISLDTPEIRTLRFSPFGYISFSANLDEYLITAFQNHTKIHVAIRVDLIDRIWTLSLDGRLVSTLAFVPKNYIQAVRFNLGLIASGIANDNASAAIDNILIAVDRKAPVINWDPLPVSPGAALTSSQLNARSNVQGAFTYSHKIGDVLGAGTHVLTATFTPSDPFRYATAAKSVTLKIDQRSRLVNLSVRSVAGVADKTLVLGFVTAEPGGLDVVSRAIGPGLVPYGVSTGALQDPSLSFRNAKGIETEQNDDWANSSALSSAFATVGAFPIDGNSKDAALLSHVSAGTSSQVVGTRGASGVTLVEIYDATKSGEARLINVSARTTAGEGLETLVGGFVIEGKAPLHVLIRAIGPTLAKYGVDARTVLPDPEFTLYRGNSPIVYVNNWGPSTSLADATAKCGAFALPPLSLDAAYDLFLEPGAYSLHVTGGNGFGLAGAAPLAKSGVVLLEIYEVP